jgi:GH24 family phage-related lysozyme (muramidase)
LARVVVGPAVGVGERMNYKWIMAAGGVAALIAIGARKMFSKTAVDIIKKHEGWSAKVYNDPVGHPTIGWGHKLLPGEKFGTITQEQGEALLQADMARIDKEITPAISVKLTENQRAALVSFAFNVGSAAVRNSTLLKKLNAGDIAGAANELDRWNKARDKKTNQLIELPGLTARRAAEKSLFLTA